MRVGLIARGEDRGLGIQSWEWARHMRPDRVLLVDPGELGRGFEIHHDRYPGATVAAWDGRHFADATAVRQWLHGVDVVYTAETFYDERLPGWCRHQGVRLVVHVNPEFWKWPGLDATTWAPTAWRLGHLPEGTEVVPVPVPLDRWPRPAPLRSNDEAVFVHVVGHRAAGDRNGTTLLLAAVQRLSVPFRLRLLTQDARLPVPRVQSCVHVERHLGGLEDYWRCYEDADVLVLPRRYGGLCLPANEAAGAGLAIVMPDCSPNGRWPITPVRTTGHVTLQTPGGTVASHTTDDRDLVAVLTRLAQNEQVRHNAQARARAWAEVMAWERWADEIRNHLAHA